MSRHKYKRVTQKQLCQEVSALANVSLADVEFILNVLIKQIKNNLCYATEDLDVWVKVAEEIAFKAVYQPKVEHHNKNGVYITGGTIIPTLELGEYEKQRLIKEYETARFYQKLQKEQEQKEQAEQQSMD